MVAGVDNGGLREAMKPAPVIATEKIILKAMTAPEKISSSIVNLTTGQSKVGKFGNFLKSTISKIGEAVPGVSSVSSMLFSSSLTPKPGFAGGSLTPKANSLTVPNVMNASGQSFTASQKSGGLGAVLGLPDTEKTNKVILYVGIALAAILLLPMLLPGLSRKRR